MDFTTYQPPGVYTEREDTPLVNVIGISPTIIGIVGPGVGYRVATEAITLSGTTPVQLANLGVNTTTGFIVRAADGTTYAGSTYALVTTSGDDAQSGTADDVTTIARVGTTIPDGSIVYVTYQYTDASYSDPLRVTDYDTVKTKMGEPFDVTTGDIISPISLAAKVAFEHGASQLVLVATNDPATASTRAGLQAGLNKLQAVYDVNVVVPLPVGISGSTGNPGDTTNVGVDLKNHVESMSNDFLYRIGIIGLDTGVTVDPATTAAGINSKRVALAYPYRLNYYNGYANTTIELGGEYLAAAYAGILASLGPQWPLTKKQIRGFLDIPSTVLTQMTKAAKNTWSSSGVAVTEKTPSGQLLIRHGVSTNPSNLYTKELSLTRGEDAMVGLLRATIDAAGLIGTPIDDETPFRVKSVVEGALQTLKTAGVIVNYKNLKAQQDDNDPTLINVKYEYKPAFPLNYILITYGINTSTGDIVPTTAA